jgi:hypothetical protein
MSEMGLVVFEGTRGEPKEKVVDRRAALKWKYRVRNKKEIEALKKSGFEFMLESKLRNYWYQRSVEIGFFRRKKGFRDLGLEDQYWKALCGIAEHQIPPTHPSSAFDPTSTDSFILIRPESWKNIISINAVDWKDKTIILKIHLDKGKDQIERDFKALLDMLYKEAKFQKRKFNEPKFHLKKLERDLDIYDKHREGNNYEEIAGVLPDSGTSAKDLGRAADRARKGFKRAEKVIGDEEYKKL